METEVIVDKKNNDVQLQISLASISIYVIQLGSGSCPQPPRPGEPVPSVPPVGEPDGSPLRYGGPRAASCTLHKDRMFGDAPISL
jgi:hypothetical protein